MSRLGSIGAPSIGGGLPFGGGGSAFGQAIGGGLGSAYMSAYNSALEQNQAMYNNILSGYQQTAQTQQANQQATLGGYNQLANNVVGNLGQTMNNTGQSQYNAQQATLGGYNQLQGNVLGTIQGITRSQSQAIADSYAQQSGGLAQQLVNRGLGNTTVQGSMQRGLSLDEQKAQVALANQQAQLTAGYQSQLGLAGLDYQNQAILQNTAQSNLSAEMQAQYGSNLGLAQLGYQGGAAAANSAQANRQLDWMNTVTAAYPNAQSYGQLSQAQAALQAQQAYASRFPAGAGGGGGYGGGGGMVGPMPPINHGGFGDSGGGIGYHPATPTPTAYGQASMATGAMGISAPWTTTGQPDPYRGGTPGWDFGGGEGLAGSSWDQFTDTGYGGMGDLGPLA